MGPLCGAQASDDFHTNTTTFAKTQCLSMFGLQTLKVQISQSLSQGVSHPLRTRIFHFKNQKFSLMAEALWFWNFVEKWVKLHLLTTSQLIQVMESDWAKARCGENMQAFSGQQHTTVTSAMWDTRHRDIGHHQLGETQTQMLQMASYNLLSSETWIPSGQNFSWVWILHQQALARLGPMEGGEVTGDDAWCQWFNW